MINFSNCIQDIISWWPHENLNRKETSIATTSATFLIFKNIFKLAILSFQLSNAREICAYVRLAILVLWYLAFRHITTRASKQASEVQLWLVYFKSYEHFYFYYINYHDYFIQYGLRTGFFLCQLQTAYYRRFHYICLASVFPHQQSAKKLTNHIDMQMKWPLTILWN